MKPFAAMVLCVAFAGGLSAATLVNQTFTFSGDCMIDCTGVGRGTLVLTGYTLGNPLVPANFVSFTYTSNFLPSFSILTPVSLSGVLPVTLPDLAGVSISGAGGVFQSVTNGSWCVGVLCFSDAGKNGIWDVGTPTPSPEPGSCALTLCGVTGLYLLRHRRQSRRGAAR